MAYQCRMKKRECDGCGACEREVCRCPNCGESGYEVRYFLDGDWIGCDECICRLFV